MKLFLFLFYETAKLLVWIVRWFYYARRTLVNAQMRDYKGPVILASNHPGTLMDPLNVAVLMNRRVNFLANASLFKTRFGNWFFSNFYCIKVERYLDTGGKPIDNKKAFQMATDYLTGGGCLYVAPEGGSYGGRFVKKVKTGPARIALNTEAANDFQLGLVILPIGLNYSEPGKFRSELLTDMGGPIRVADFKEDWEKDQKEAVRKLTLHLKEKLAEQLIYAADEAEDELLKKAETILASENMLPPQPTYFRSKKTLQHLQYLRSKKPVVYESFSEKINDYFAGLHKRNIVDASVKENTSAHWLLIIILFPFFLIGYLVHFLPAFLASKLSDKFSSDPVWVPTIKILGGLIIYPVVLWLQYLILKKVFGGIGDFGFYLKWGYVPGFFLFGWVAELFLKKWRLFVSKRNWKRFKAEKPAASGRLLNLRDEILQVLSA
ncbi:MAG: 1-acyl-sn-glycerol-3-phosphate acyltransferase [Bacteroidota bacterium]